MTTTETQTLIDTGHRVLREADRDTAAFIAFRAALSAASRAKVTQVESSSDVVYARGSLEFFRSALQTARMWSEACEEAYTEGMAAIDRLATVEAP